MKKISYLMLMCCFGASAVQAEEVFDSPFYTGLVEELDCDLDVRGVIDFDGECYVNSPGRDDQVFTLSGIESSTLKYAKTVQVNLDYTVPDNIYGHPTYDKVDCSDIPTSSTGIESEAGVFSRTCTVNSTNTSRTLTANSYSYNSGYGYEIAIDDMPDPANDFPATSTSYDFTSGSVNFRDPVTDAYKVVDSADYAAGTHSCVSTHTVKIYVNATNTSRDYIKPDVYEGQTEYAFKPNLFTTWNGTRSGGTDKARIYNYYYCGSESVNNYLFKQYTSAETCILTPSWDTSDAFAKSLQTVGYACTLNSTKRVYWGHKELVPVMVGDISIFVPVPKVDGEAIRTDNVYSGNTSHYDDSYIYNQPTSKAELICDGPDNFGYSKSSSIIDTTDPKFDRGATALSTSELEEKSFSKSCSNGIRVKSSFVDSSGTLLPFTFAEGSVLTYDIPSDGLDIWTETAQYLQENIEGMLSELTVLNVAAAFTGDDEELRKNVLCAASSVFYDVGLGRAMWDTPATEAIVDTDRSTAHFNYSECSNRGGYVWWEYADNYDNPVDPNNPDDPYYVPGYVQEVESGEIAFDYTNGEVADSDYHVLSSMSIIEDVNKMSSGVVAATLQARHEVVMTKLNSFLNNETAAYVSRATDLAEDFQFESCNALELAVDAMILKLNNYNDTADAAYQVTSVNKVDCSVLR